MRWVHRYLSKHIRSSLLSGLIVAFATLLLSAFLLTALMNSIDLPLFVFYFLNYSCHVIAIFLGVLHTTLRRKKRGLFNGIRVSAVYALIIWMSHYFTSDSTVTWLTPLLFGFAIVIGAASGVWALQLRTRRKK